jgi:choline dehydrogenase-like flavoprotein
MNTFETFWHYHSEAASDRCAAIADAAPPPGLKPMLLDIEEKPDFEISFTTQRFKPNHRVTLRNSVDGWGRDVYGTYWYGAWRFKFEKSEYPAGFQFKFRLDNSEWHLGDNFTIDTPRDEHLGEDRVQFSSGEDRFIHGYENLRVAEDEQQQNLLRTNYSEKELWDVIVIGSGMGGGVLADALTDFPDKKLKVLVLDAGSLDYSTHVDNIPVAGLGRVIGGHQVRHFVNDSGETRFGEAVQMNLGGRSVFWSGLIPRMRDWELRRWPDAIRKYLSNGGYESAEKLMRKHVAAGEFQENTIAKLKPAFPGWDIVNTPRSSHQPEFGTENNPEEHPASFLFRSTGTFSAAELLLDSLTSSNDPGHGRLHVNLNHLVTHLEHDGHKVTGVVCQDLVGNRTRTYRGKVIVLAAGSLESVKIALKSKLRDPHDKIGVGLTDHPSYYAPDGLFGGQPFLIRPGSPYAGPNKHARIFFYPNEAWEGHYFNVEIVINGQYWRSRHADDDVLRAQHPDNVRTTINFKFVFGSEVQEGNFVRLGGPEEKLIVRHLPNPSGADGRPAVVKLLAQLHHFFDVEPVDLNQDGNCHFGNGGTVNHAGATLRMGNQGTARVVDENLKFEAYENLYACDPSVYPYIPAANPSLTLVALSLRLAKHLAEKI